MNKAIQKSSTSTYWFVGATYGGTEDQTSRFFKEGIWHNGCKDKYLDLVKAMKPGEQIAIKSSYTRKHDLPFDNRGHFVAVMAIKAIGTITKNWGDGHKLDVDWTPVEPQREWYFYTNRSTVWRVLPGDWEADALIEFTFDSEPQDIDRFRNEPFWRERFGNRVPDEPRFEWTGFYEAMADALLAYKHDRKSLIKELHAISRRVGGLLPLNDKFSSGKSSKLKDICPFTTFGMFNRGITVSNRKLIATQLANFLGVEAPVPDSFEGIPVLNNQNSWFFSFSTHRQDDDIDALWRIFETAIRYADSEDDEFAGEFVDAYDDALSRRGVAWNLTTGMYWARPWKYPTLEGQSREYIENKLNIDIPTRAPRRRCNGTDYLALMDKLESLFDKDIYPVHSFPELSYSAWLYTGDDADQTNEAQEENDSEADAVADTEIVDAPIQPYSIRDILDDGCFLKEDELDAILNRLRMKKNLILQGPPGTGKTWLAKRLAYALIGQKDERKVKAVQFHPNLSYEDFIRGWRPTGDGKLDLVDGPFMEMVNTAMKNPSERHVIVIEEINRGNPAQIFGEMLTLLEADKRTPNESLELCYRKKHGEKVYIPDKLFVIGTMNIADRSLALVDLALRRRFAFVDLEPKFGKVWRDWVCAQNGTIDSDLREIESRLEDLNAKIASDAGLGPQFKIGHSYVTPTAGTKIDDAHHWFRQVVETEIGPLLREYWFDALDKAQKAEERLVKGL